VSGIVKGVSYGAALANAVALEPIMRWRGSAAVLLTVNAVSLAVAIWYLIPDLKRRLTRNVVAEIPPAITD
jgi:hypothetical protein